MSDRRWLLLRFPNDITRNAALSILLREMRTVPFEDFTTAADLMQRAALNFPIGEDDGERQEG
jgi:hypothetical protein